jgi:hypothetical protein
MEGIRPILPQQPPESRTKDTSYYNRQVKEKQLQDGTIQQRVRGTFGGNNLNYLAEMELVKAHIHSVASDRLLCHLAEYMNMDITDYYFGAPFPRPEYMRIPVKDIPPRCFTDFGLSTTLEAKIASCFRLSYAFKVCHKLDYCHSSDSWHILRFMATMKTRTFLDHASRPILFTLVVDDFGVKYQQRTDVEHLAAAIV